MRGSRKRGIAGADHQMAAIDGISVIITAFNAETTIERAVRSALREPHVQEVIVVDDCSSDATIAGAQQADDGSGRLRIIRLARNGGPSAARNAGIAAGAAPLIAILDADDYFLPGRFAAMPEGDWDLLADNIAFIPEGSSEPEIAVPLGGPRQRLLGLDEFLDRNISRRGRLRSELGFLKPVIRRASLERLGLAYDENLRLGEDFILYATAIARGARFMLSEFCGYVAEVRPHSLSGRHRTADLAALARADRALAEELARIEAPSASRTMLRYHMEALDQKVATRRYIDEKHRVGLLRATIDMSRHPKHLIGAGIEILDGIVRRYRPTPQPPVRMLFAADDFALPGII